MLTFPWGVGEFLLFVVAGFIIHFTDEAGLPWSTYIEAMATGTGLLAIGHGVHHAARERYRR
jgi:hypothetical protein